MYVSDAVYVTRKFFVEHDIEDTLTVRYLPHGERYRKGDKVDPRIVVTPWKQKGALIGIPRQFGLNLISKLGLEAEDRMSYGYRRVFPLNVTHTGAYAYQDAFVAELLRLAETSNDFLVSAATGKGKTVMALSVIQKMGTTAVVVVDQENLLTQWVDRAKQVLGLTDDQIGVVQGDKCEYKGKHIVIAMIQSLTRREYDPRLYSYFGVAVFDEAHTTGAAMFSRALSMFSAAVRFGVSATIDRGDALQKILHFNLGQVRAELLDKHDTSYIYYLESPTVYSWYANISPKTGRILSEVAEDTDRNSMIAAAVKWLYDSGRDVLVLSDRIEQLEALTVLCEGLGIPGGDMGAYCGYRNVWLYEKDPSPPRRPPFYERNTEYTPVRLTTVQKKIPKKDKDRVLHESRVIFATYGMFAKGVDVPRLSGGIDCTPRAKASQVHGRILRVKHGKLVPIWVTIRDTNSYRIDHQFVQRVLDYSASSAEIYQWKPGKGVRQKDVRSLVSSARKNSKNLKKRRIETLPDGNNMLVIPTTPSV